MAVPVLIIGAGPSGLSMALELTRHHIPFRIIDKEIKPVSTSNALAVQPRTLEVWDDNGILPIALEKGLPINRMNIYNSYKSIAALEFKNLDTMYPFILALAQSCTEEILIEALRKQNVQVEMEVELIDLATKSNGIEVTLKKKNNSEENIIISYLIACDGYHSTVRDILKIPFLGKELKQHFIIADVITEEALPKEAVGILSSKGPLLLIPLSENHSRLIAEVTNEPDLKFSKSPTKEQMNEIIKKRCKLQIRIKENVWSSGFYIHERIAETFQHQNIFLLGDAAHVHSPAGGQGMNTGIQDAYNLAWKLAYVIKGKARPELLESYNLERYPVARAVLSRSGLITSIGTLHNPVSNYLRNAFIIFAIRYTHLAQKFLKINSQLTVNYRKSKLSCECIKNHAGPKAGDRILDTYLDNSKQQRLFTFLQGTKPCILFFSGILLGTQIQSLLEIQDKIVKQYQNLFKCIIISAVKEDDGHDIGIIYDKEQLVHRKYSITIPTIVFIRPDKYIGFRGNVSDQDKLFTYINNIFESF